MELNEDMTYHESYGTMPRHLMRMVDRMNISPADWDMLTSKFGTDWDGMREFINAHRSQSNGSFTFPFGVSF